MFWDHLKQGVDGTINSAYWHVSLPNGRRTELSHQLKLVNRSDGEIRQINTGLFEQVQGDNQEASHFNKQ